MCILMICNVCVWGGGGGECLALQQRTGNKLNSREQVSFEGIHNDSPPWSNNQTCVSFHQAFEDKQQWGITVVLGSTAICSSVCVCVCVCVGACVCCLCMVCVCVCVCGCVCVQDGVRVCR